MTQKRGSYEYESERQHAEFHDWGNAWSQAIAEACGGLSVYHFWRVRFVLQECRAKLLAGDLGPPRDQVNPPAMPKPQGNLFEAAE